MPQTRTGCELGAVGAAAVVQDAGVLSRVAVLPIWILLAAVGVGLLDGIVWPGSMLALFRPHLAALLIAGTLLALLSGRLRTAAAACAGALLAAALVAPAVWVERAAAPVDRRETVRLLLLNLSHRNDDARRVAALIGQERPDVIALIEYTPRWQRRLSAALASYPRRALAPREGATGIGVFGREALRAAAVRFPIDADVPAVEATISSENGPIQLLAVHPPFPVLPADHDAHEALLQEAGRWAAARGPRSAVCGDLNATPWTRALRRTLGDGRLRTALPAALAGGTWPRLPAPLRLPLDGCLVGERIRARAVIQAHVGSDHRPVIVELG